MNIKELVEDLKSKGVPAEEIKSQLEAMKQEIDEILAGEQPKEEEQPQEETEEAKMNRVFGL